MLSFPVNVWAVAVAALARFLIGFAYFMPPLFGKAWMDVMGYTPRQMSDKTTMIRGMGIDLAACFVIAGVLVHAVHYAGATTALQGAAVGFLNWLAFTALTSLAGATIERRAFKLWMILAGNSLIALTVMGAILAVWV
jgi:hypothetical protein